MMFAISRREQFDGCHGHDMFYEIIISQVKSEAYKLEALTHDWRAEDTVNKKKSS